MLHYHDKYLHLPSLHTIIQERMYLQQQGPRYTKLLKDWILNLAGNGRTVLLSTHIIEMVESLCTKIAIIDQGKLLAIGSVREIQMSTGLNNLEDAFIRLIGAN